MRQFEQERVDQLLKLFPGPITLTTQPGPVRDRLVLTCVWAGLSLLLVFPGTGSLLPAFTRHHQVASGLTSAMLAAFCGLIIVLSKGDAARPRALILDSDRFQTTGANAIGAFAWEDVEEFHVPPEADGPTRVALVLFESDGRTRRSDREYRFKHEYGLSAEALSSLLGGWCDAAWRHRNPPRYEGTN